MHKKQLVDQSINGAHVQISHVAVRDVIDDVTP